MAYARHQSFYLRDKWISKGLKAVHKNDRFFYDTLAFEKIGLGKNMVQSLKFWLLATGLIEENDEDGKRSHGITDLGGLIYENDRLLQFNDTVAILHYNLVRNKEDLSTVFEWYFNKYIETKAKKDEIIDAFTYWVSQRESKEVSENSLRRDIDCLVPLYTKKANMEDPEDITFSPFTKLNVMKVQRSGEGKFSIIKTSPNIDDVGLTALYYILISKCNEMGQTIISIDDIIKGDHLWGRVYNLSRSTIVEALNRLTNHKRYPVQYIRTNNLDNIIIPEITATEFLFEEYHFKG
jgi:hypothetical protein